MLFWKTQSRGWIFVFAELLAMIFGRISMTAADVEKVFATCFESYAERIAATVPLMLVLRVVMMMKVMVLVTERLVQFGKRSMAAVVVNIFLSA